MEPIFGPLVGGGLAGLLLPTLGVSLPAAADPLNHEASLFKRVPEVTASPDRCMSIADVILPVRYDANLQDDEGVCVPSRPIAADLGAR